jgi:hypothetical protein
LAAGDVLSHYASPLGQALGLKTLPVYVFLIAGVGLHVRWGFPVAAAFIPSLLFVNPAVAPVVVSVFLVLCFGLLARTWSLGECWPALASMVGVAIFFALFYFWNDNRPFWLNGSSGSTAWGWIAPRWTMFLALRTLILVLLLYLPALLIVAAGKSAPIYHLPSRLRPLRDVLLVAVPLAFLVWSTSRSAEGVQFFGLSVFPALNLYLFVVLVHSERKRLRVAATLLMASAVVVWSRGVVEASRPLPQSDRYLCTVASGLKGRSLGGFLQPPEALVDSSPFTRNVRWNVRGNYTAVLPGVLGAVSLDDVAPLPGHEDPILGPLRRSSVFARSLDEARSHDPSLTVDSVRKAFVCRHSLRYLILAPGVEVPRALSDLASSIERDERSGEAFAWFDPDPPGCRPLLGITRAGEAP